MRTIRYQICAISLFTCVCIATHVSAAQKPNIIVIMTDDLGYGDLNCYGANTNIIRTPRIDQLATEGLRFTDGHCSASTCTPSRYSFLTGEYAWRTPGTGIGNGLDPLLIAPGKVTVASMLKSAGYVTTVIGKWHLGLGSGTTDYNHPPIMPGPIEIGFDSCFIIPATPDRVPCVFVENHSIYNFDPADPLLISYSAQVGSQPTGSSNPELLKYYSAGGQHSKTIINGISRIGWMDGVTNAWWRDEDFADIFLARTSAFIEQHTNSPFFIYLATADIHVPRAPHERFQGTSGQKWRGDAIHEMDWLVGAVVDKLAEFNLTTNTMIVFTSDNGPVMDDGYDDDFAAGINVDDYGPHDLNAANGPFQGGKYNLWEGGTRVPFIVWWPGTVASNSISSALVLQTDLLASLAALTGQPLPTDAGPDSENVLPALLGQSATGRATFVGQNNASTPRSLRSGDWKYMGNSGNLYDLASDPAESTNLSGSNPSKASEMSALLTDIGNIPLQSSWLAWWPLNDGSGTNALDRSLNGYSGKLINTPAWVSQSNITFLSFNGTNQSVAVANLPSDSSDITLACWARSQTETWNASGSLMSRRPQFVLNSVAGTKHIGVQFYNSTGGLQNLEFDLAGVAGFSLTNWHHYAATYMAATGNAQLFVDGVLRTNATLLAGPLGATTNALTLGSDSSGEGTFFQGDLADVRIYNQVLTSQRIANTASAILLDADGDTMLDDWEVRFGLNPLNAADALLDADGDGITNKFEFQNNTSPLVPNTGGVGGLIGYWKFDETNGLAAVDSSGSGNNGALSNSPAWTSEAGRHYLHFTSASQQFVEVVGLPNLNSDVTLACWAKSDTTNWNVAGCLVSRRPQWILHPWVTPANSNRLSFLVFNSGNQQLTADVNLAGFPEFQITNWHHYAGTYDAGAGLVKLYVDGLLAGVTNITPGVLQSNTGPVGFGRDYTGTRYFDGSLDEVRLYNRVLEANEIMALTAGFDDDQDGMADEVERQIINFNPGDAINTLAQVLPQDDFDGDGFKNRDEAIAGTSATSAADYFHIANFDASGSESPFSVFVDGHVGRTYFLERCHEIGGSWQVINQSQPVTSEAPVELDDPDPGADRAFYRVSVIAVEGQP